MKAVLCADCPWRREGGIRLTAGRYEEIATTEGQFSCHKTVHWSDDEDEDGEPIEKDQGRQRPCAGWLVFLMKETAPLPGQMARVLMRLGTLTEEQFEAWKGLVFDSLREAQQEAI